MYLTTPRLWADALFSEPSRSLRLPLFDVSYDEHGARIEADLPGVKAADLDVSVEGTTLTIQGSRKGRGSFTRRFSLADDLDLESLAAKLEDGVLTVSVARQPKAQPRKILVSEGSV